MVTQDSRLHRPTDATDVTAPEFPIVQQETTRSGVNIMNVWMMILNADHKFEVHRKRYGFQHLPDPVVEVIDLTMEITRWIYRRIAPTTDTGLAGMAGKRWSDRWVLRPDHAEGNDNGEGPSQGLASASQSGDGGWGVAGSNNHRGHTSDPARIDNFLSLSLGEMEELGKEWFGYHRVMANQDELFGRQPDSAYKSSDKIMQWMADVE
ncbi:hypothetical protein FRB93_005780 [Tulasnella sp. JGI-2019a]|nr:hypothetical protein FRB93_005780 [Tulasnella sp. JGI-2019a]